MSELESVIVGVLTDQWQGLDDVINTVRMRRSVGYFGILTALKRLRDKGVAERRGKRGSYELRLAQKETPSADG